MGWFDKQKTWESKKTEENKWWVKYCFNLRAEASRRNPQDKNAAEAQYWRWHGIALSYFYQEPKH